MLSMPTAAIDLCAQVLIGYALVALTPGPNLLLVGSTAALRGFPAAARYGAGMALAVGTIAVLACLGAAMLPRSPAWTAGFGAVSALLLLLAALRMGRRPGDAPPAEAAAGGLFAGFRVAVCNPVTVAYFSAAFAGPLQEGDALAGWLVALGAAAVSLGIGLLYAALLARPPVRRVVLSRQAQMRVVTAALLGLCAVSTLIGALSPFAAATADLRMDAILPAGMPGSVALAWLARAIG